MWHSRPRLCGTLNSRASISPAYDRHSRGRLCHMGSPTKETFDEPSHQPSSVPQKQHVCRSRLLDRCPRHAGPKPLAQREAQHRHRRRRRARRVQHRRRAEREHRRPVRRQPAELEPGRRQVSQGQEIPRLAASWSSRRTSTPSWSAPPTTPTPRPAWRP